jgi:hypothetical protein
LETLFTIPPTVLAEFVTKMADGPLITSTRSTTLKLVLPLGNLNPSTKFPSLV